MSHKKKAHQQEMYSAVSCVGVTQEHIVRLLDHEITWSNAKGGGHGGQNVNKRHTTAEGYFNIKKSAYLHSEQKDRLLAIYHNHVSNDGVLRLTCHEQRNYHRNLHILQDHFKKVFSHAGKESIFDRHHTS